MSEEKMEEDRTPGIFSWQELVTGDPDGSKQFYTELLGWEMESMDMGGGKIYHMFSAGPRPVAGMFKPPAEAGEVPTSWVSYVTVENLEATVSRAEKLGAKVCVPITEVPGKGRFANMVDPQGAAIAFWEFA
ncbi:MAG: VOC family protein [Verrucomicrobiota bacterium]